MNGVLLQRFFDLMKGRQGPASGAILFAVALGATLFLFIPSRSVLVVQKLEPDTLVFCAPLAEAEEWTIAYTHSVNRRPVYDTLRLEGNGLRILRSRFDAFAAGMPDGSVPDDALRLGPDGWLECRVDRRLPDLTIRVGRVAGHQLRIKGRTIPLTNFAPPGSALRFSAAHWSRYQFWKGRCTW